MQMSVVRMAGSFEKKPSDFSKDDQNGTAVEKVVLLTVQSSILTIRPSQIDIASSGWPDFFCKTFPFSEGWPDIRILRTFFPTLRPYINTESDKSLASGMRF